jgi:hypothetical protein
MVDIKAPVGRTRRYVAAPQPTPDYILIFHHCSRPREIRDEGSVKAESDAEEALARSAAPFRCVPFT